MGNRSRYGTSLIECKILCVDLNGPQCAPFRCVVYTVKVCYSKNDVLTFPAEKKKSHVSRDKFLQQHDHSVVRNEDALLIYDNMCKNGVSPHLSITLAALKECSRLRNMQTGRRLHADLINTAEDKGIDIANSLMHLYTKCLSMSDACSVFDRTLQYNVASWNAIISGYIECGGSDIALKLFAFMQEEDCKPNARTYLSALKACASCAEKGDGNKGGANSRGKMCLEYVISIHSQLAKSGHEMNIFVGSTLVDVYAKCGSITHAHQVFNRMPYHDEVSWNALIFGYVDNGDGEFALHIFALMQDEGFTPNSRSYLAALKACAICAGKEEGEQVDKDVIKVKWLEQAISIHSQLAKGRHELDIFVANILVDMYAKCGSAVHVWQVFDKMLCHNEVSWNSIIFGCLESGKDKLALDLFAQMREKGFTPNVQTYIAALKACASCAGKDDTHNKGRFLKTEFLEKGISIHSQLRKAGHELDIFVASTLVDMYAKCRSMVHACSTFDRMFYHDVVTWNALIFGYAEIGEGEMALQVLEQMQDEGFMPDTLTYIAALKACNIYGAKEELKQVRDKLPKIECLEKGIGIHSRLSKSGYELDRYVSSTLLDMYASFGSMVHAHLVFDRMSHHDVVSWNAMIFGCVNSGDGKLALQCFAHMQDNGFVPNAQTYIAALNACSSCCQNEGDNQVLEVKKMDYLEKGKAIHSQLAKKGYELDIFVVSALVDMYAKSGSLMHCHWIFGKTVHHDIVTWNAIIYAYEENGEAMMALQLLAQMQDEGFTPNARTYVPALNACCDMVKLDSNLVDGIESLERVIAIHSQLTKNGYELDNFVASTMVNVYAKCGSMIHAHLVFDKMLHYSVVSWNAMIFGYSESGESELALDVFAFMQDEGHIPAAQTYVAAIKACATCAAKEEAKQVDGKFMRVESLEKGMVIHSQLLNEEDEFHRITANSLVDMYAKCGSMMQARQVFERIMHHDVVSWNTLIFGYVENGESKIAIELFACMQDEGSTPDSRTYVAALKACASCTAEEESREIQGHFLKVESLEKGISIHSQFVKSGHALDIIMANTLVHMYANCRSMEHAHWIFESMLHHSVETWTAIIFGYTDSGEPALALKLFACMQNEGFSPDNLAYVAALKACGSIAAFEAGKRLHDQICKAGFLNDTVVASCLIALYGKCGSMFDAEVVFASLNTKDLITWNALLAGYALQGDIRRVLDLFQRMQGGCFQADGITFLSILTACCHAGLVDKGKDCFQMMSVFYACPPGAEHYACMVDILGRANHLDESLEVAKNMPFEPDLTIWKTVLGACQKWKNKEVGRLAFEFIQGLNDKDSSAYVLMANIYAGFDMCKDDDDCELSSLCIYPI